MGILESLDRGTCDWAQEGVKAFTPDTPSGVDLRDPLARYSAASEAAGPTRQLLAEEFLFDEYL